MQPLVRVALFASLFIGHARAQAPQPVTPVGLPIPGAPVLDTHPTLTKAATVKITGSSPDATEIEVAGPRGVFRIPVTAGRFATVLPLIANRTNPFHFTAIFDDLRSATTLTRVTRDNQPPHLFIDGPDDGARVTVTKVDVFGRVGDALSGFKNLMVTVNDAKAQVNVGIGTNGTFFAMGVPLLVSSPPEATEIRVFASDDFGNRAGRSVWVTHVPIPPGVPKMEIPPLKGGNGQEGQMRSQLPKPIVVKVLDGNGKPFAGKSLTFEVVRSDGLLKPLIGGKGSRVLQLRADKLGLAKVLWTLGTDAGSGNNRVRVTARDIAGTILFCASAKPAPPRQINVATGDHEVAAVSSPAPEPLRVWVNDGCNGLAGKRVTFKVVRGSGKVNGESEITVQTDRTGHASVRFVLGPEPITQRVEADVTNNSRFPAVFEIQGIARQGLTPASFVGRVVDNSDQAIGNCPIHLSVNHKLLPTVWTDKDGRFRIDKILESGEGVLVAEASEATRLGEKTIPKKSFPDMMFHPVLVPNAENRLGAPIRIPPLDLGSARVVDGTKDVTLTCSAIQGLEFRIPKGRILWKGEPVTPQRPVTVSLSQVHFDEIPMALPDGAAPPFAWTLQPAGLLFEKPVQITMPNMVGLAPSSIVYFLSFDHDLGRFLIVATGSVSKDGASLVSDPGSGIRKSGWGGFCPPYPSVGVVAVDAWRDALEAILDYLAKIKGADGPRDFALAELMLCSAKR
ncbi:MAG: hypothetical protein ACE5F1_15260, partial [Planctomycetota bacterium]